MNLPDFWTINGMSHQADEFINSVPLSNTKRRSMQNSSCHAACHNTTWKKITDILCWFCFCYRGSAWTTNLKNMFDMFVKLDQIPKISETHSLKPTTNLPFPPWNSFRGKGKRAFSFLLRLARPIFRGLGRDVTFMEVYGSDWKIGTATLGFCEIFHVFPKS